MKIIWTIDYCNQVAHTSQLKVNIQEVKENNIPYQEIENTRVSLGFIKYESKRTFFCLITDIDKALWNMSTLDENSNLLSNYCRHLGDDFDEKEYDKYNIK